MDGDYVFEQMIRDRIADARATAQWNALRRQSSEGRQRSNGILSRLIDLGRNLRNLVAATQAETVTKRS